MNLDCQNALKPTCNFLMIVQFKNGDAIDLVNDVVAPRNNDILVPVFNGYLKGWFFRDEPFNSHRIHHHAVTISSHQEPPSFLVELTVVLNNWMNI